MTTQTVSPASVPGKTAAERKRIPMSAPVQKLEVPEIPGYHLHWMRGTPDRLEQAQNAGYEFVDRKEVKVNSVGLGSPTAISGSTDLGSRVSVVAGGGDSEGGQATRMYLMKIKLELWNEDQASLQRRNDSVADALTYGVLGKAQTADANENMRYVGSRTKLPDLFTKKKSKS